MWIKQWDSNVLRKKIKNNESEGLFSPCCVHRERIIDNLKVKFYVEILCN